MTFYNRDTVVAATAGQVWCDLGTEAVVLGLTDDTYYGLNDVGALIWSLVQAPRAVRELCHAVLSEFEVEPEVCERDILALLEAMMQRALVHTVEPSASR